MRRRIVRFSRRFGGQRVAPAPSSNIILPGTWDGGYWDSEDGPVDVGGGKVDPWVPLEGATNLSQSSSGDRGTLTTDYFGGANSVLFNGTNERMIANALASLAAGNDVAVTLAINAHFVSVGTNDSSIAFGSGGTPYHLLTTDVTTGAQWRCQRRDDGGGGGVVREAGTTSTGVHRLIMSYGGAADETVTLWDNGVKVLDASAFAVAGDCTLIAFSIACRILGTAGNFAHIAVKNVAVRSGPINDADAATLNTAWGG